MKLSTVQIDISIVHLRIETAIARSIPSVLSILRFDISIATIRDRILGRQMRSVLRPSFRGGSEKWATSPALYRCDREGLSGTPQGCVKTRKGPKPFLVFKSETQLWFLLSIFPRGSWLWSAIFFSMCFCFKGTLGVPIVANLKSYASSDLYQFYNRIVFNYKGFFRYLFYSYYFIIFILSWVYRN